MKYSADLRNRICALLATGEQTIVDVCAAVGIDKATYYRWRETKKDFRDALKAAEPTRKAALGEMALSGLAQLLQGYEWTEVTEEWDLNKEGKPRKVGEKRVKKRVLPNATAVLFTLKNHGWSDTPERDPTEPVTIIVRRERTGTHSA